MVTSKYETMFLGYGRYLVIKIIEHVTVTNMIPLHMAESLEEAEDFIEADQRKKHKKHVPCCTKTDTSWYFRK